MTNQTPVEYCRHENCGKREVLICACNPSCELGGHYHVDTGRHHCNASGKTFAEPADPPPMPHDKEYAEFADELRNYNFEPSLEVDTDQIRKLKAGTQMEERKATLESIRQLVDEWERAYSLDLWNEVTESDYGKLDSATFAGRWAAKMGGFMVGVLKQKLAVPVSESANREPQASKPEKITFDHNVNGDATYAWFENKYYTLDHDDCVRKLVAAVVERELHELRAQRARFFNEAASLRGLVGRMLSTLIKKVDHSGFPALRQCTLCGADGELAPWGLSIPHKKGCLISEAEAAIKEPHNRPSSSSK